MVTERAAAAAFMPDTDRKRLLDEVIRPGYAALRGEG
jgi:adenosine deaminase